MASDGVDQTDHRGFAHFEFVFERLDLGLLPIHCFLELPHRVEEGSDLLAQVLGVTFEAQAVTLRGAGAGCTQ